MHSFETNYLDSARMIFQQYKLMGEKTFIQLSDQDLFWKYDDEMNSIAIIVNHLSGNMKSRFTDFLTTDGEKSWRHRDSEFEDEITSREQMIEKWNEGWRILFGALKSISTDNINTIIYIRNEPHTIMDAVNRQLTHYAYHIGQIVFIGRMIKGDSWQTLSIAKGKSAEFNASLFNSDETDSKP